MASAICLAWASSNQSSNDSRRRFRLMIQSTFLFWQRRMFSRSSCPASIRTNSLAGRDLPGGVDRLVQELRHPLLTVPATFSQLAMDQVTFVGQVSKPGIEAVEFQVRPRHAFLLRPAVVEGAGSMSNATHSS